MDVAELLDLGAVQHPLSVPGHTVALWRVLQDVAAQEGCDSEEYDLMVTASKYILALEAEWSRQHDELQDAYAEMRKQRRLITCVFDRDVWDRADLAVNCDRSES